MALLDTLLAIPSGARSDLLGAVLSREPYLRKYITMMQEPWKKQSTKRIGCMMDDVKTLLRRHDKQLRADGMLKSQQDDDENAIPNDARADLCRYFNLCWIIEKVEYLMCLPLGTKAKSTETILKKLNQHRDRVHSKLKDDGYL